MLTLTALGMINALGNQTASIWRRLCAGDLTGLTHQSGYAADRAVLVGQVTTDLPALPEKFKRYDCRNNRLALSALQSIEETVQAAIKKYGASRLGVVMGSSTSGLASTEAAYSFWKREKHLPSSFDYIQHEMGGLAAFLADYAGIQGPAYTLSTACSSSAKVFASARALIRQGWCDAVVVGGADSLCRLTVQGFTALEALSDEPSNSMSRHRRGFNVGEGAALFLLERAEQGVALLGVGESSDAHHMSAPDPAGTGARLAMEKALDDATIQAREVSYVNLHGTATPLNDPMESRAVSELFPDTLVSSTKSMVGHTLGASGAMEVGFCWLALTQMAQGQVHLPPHLWDGQADEALPTLRLVAPGQTLPERSNLTFMSNSFGFGGSNCSVLLRRIA